MRPVVLLLESCHQDSQPPDRPHGKVNYFCSPDPRPPSPASPLVQQQLHGTCGPETIRGEARGGSREMGRNYFGDEHFRQSLRQPLLNGPNSSPPPSSPSRHECYAFRSASWLGARGLQRMLWVSLLVPLSVPRRTRTGRAAPSDRSMELKTPAL